MGFQGKFTQGTPVCLFGVVVRASRKYFRIGGRLGSAAGMNGSIPGIRGSSLRRIPGEHRLQLHGLLVPIIQQQVDGLGDVGGSAGGQHIPQTVQILSLIHI